LGDQYPEVQEKLARDRVFELYETGGLTSEEFIDALRFCASPALSAEDVTEVWNSIFLDMPRARLDMLLRLRQNYKVFLLSNINEMHEHWIADYMLRVHGVTDFESTFFDGVYYSHLVRLRKPDREIYEYVLADAELKPEQTLFFDDLEVNVKAASELGIRGIVHPLGTEIITHVEQFAILHT
jgi:putative hydrolase of the HAD superfamily